MKQFRLFLWVAVSLRLAAQEEGGITFDPKYIDSGSPFDWTSLVFALAGGIAIFWSRTQLFPALNRYALRYRKAVRYGVPVAMLSSAWITVLLEPHALGRFQTVVTGVIVLFLLANSAPFLIAACALMVSSHDPSAVQAGMVFAVVDLMFWYGLMRFWQYRLNLNRDLSLHLSESSRPSS